MGLFFLDLKNKNIATLDFLKSLNFLKIFFLEGVV